MKKALCGILFMPLILAAQGEKITQSGQSSCQLEIIDPSNDAIKQALQLDQLRWRTNDINGLADKLYLWDDERAFTWSPGGATPIDKDTAIDAKLTEIKTWIDGCTPDPQ